MDRNVSRCRAPRAGRWRFITLGALLVVAGHGCERLESQGRPLPLFEGTTIVEPGEYVTAAREGRILPDGVTSGAAALDVTLSEGETVTLLRDGFERRGDDVTWRGRLQGDDSSRVVLTYHLGYVAGTIQRGTALYRIRPSRDSLHIIERLDVNRLPRQQ